MKRIIFETEDKTYRIIEVLDCDFDIENLKGDLFDPKHVLEMHGPEKTIEQLKEDERKFERKVDELGVYGYVLEKWDATPGHGYEALDSCWGFIGAFDSKVKEFNHYIVDELKGQIK